MGIEKLTDKQLDSLHAKCQRMAANSRRLLDQAAKERATREAAKNKAKPRAAPASARRRR
jgi:hypothetical protein